MRQNTIVLLKRTADEMSLFLRLSRVVWKRDKKDFKKTVLAVFLLPSLVALTLVVTTGMTDFTRPLFMGVYLPVVAVIFLGGAGQLFAHIQQVRTIKAFRNGTSHM